jgi:hypothetical protein
MLFVNERLIDFVFTKTLLILSLYFFNRPKGYFLNTFFLFLIMDFAEKIQAKLDALNSANTPKTERTVSEANKVKFVPQDGKYVFRVLPNFHLGKDRKPYLPLDFYYEFGRTVLAPVQFEEPDAIAEFYQTLVAEYTREKDKEKNRTLWQASLKFKPQQRICVPIIVRSYTDINGKTTNGLELEGVKFWWFSPKTYRDLEAIANDPDYGNIFDLKTGRDITMEYTPKEKTATGYPQISILPKPKETPVSNDKDVLEMIKNMPNIVDLHTKPTYAETQEMIQSYLYPKTPAEKPVVKEDSFLKEMNAPVTPHDPIGEDVDFDNLFKEEN